MYRSYGISPAKINNRYFYMSRWCILLIFVATLLGFLPHVAIVYASVAVHECCHLLMCRAMGVYSRHMMILPYGMELRLGCLVAPGKNIIICLAGPVSNFVLFLAGFAISGCVSNGYISFFTGANFILFVFNLFPCTPMDGGEILRCVLGIRYGVLNSYRAISAISYVWGCLLFGAGVVFAWHTGGNITLLVVALPVFVSIAKLEVTYVYATRDILLHHVPRAGKIRLVSKSCHQVAGALIKHISYGYTLVVAVQYPRGKWHVISQDELIDAVNCKNIYATLGECVDLCKKSCDIK